MNVPGYAWLDSEDAASAVKSTSVVDSSVLQ